MGLAQSIRIANAYVQLGVRGEKRVENLLRKAQANIANTAATITRTGAQITAIGVAGAAPFALSIKSASDFQETMAKFKVVFADRNDEVLKWAETFGDAVGRSTDQVTKFLAEAQDLFVPIGFDPLAAEEMSKQVTKLAVDLASFNNKADADVLRDLQAALTGSSETVKKYGVIVNEAAVKQQLLNDGLDPKLATDQEKVAARLAIIMAATVSAQGDAIRSGDAFANQQKRLKASIEETATAVGTSLLEPATKLVSTANAIVESTKRWVSGNQALVPILATVAVGTIAVGSAVTATGLALGLYAKALGGLIAVKQTYITVSAFFAKATLTSRAALAAARLSVVGLAAAIGLELVKSLSGASKAFGDLAQEVAKSRQQIEELNQLAESRNARTLEDIAEIPDADRRRTALLELHKRQATELEKQIEQTQRIKERLNAAVDEGEDQGVFDILFGNAGEVLGKATDLRTAYESSNATLQQQVDAIQKTKAALQRENTKASSTVTENIKEQLDREQEFIDLLPDGEDREIRQIELNYKIDQIDTQFPEALAAKRERDLQAVREQYATEAIRTAESTEEEIIRLQEESTQKKLALLELEFRQRSRTTADQALLEEKFARDKQRILQDAAEQAKLEAELTAAQSRPQEVAKQAEQAKRTFTSSGSFFGGFAGRQGVSDPQLQAQLDVVSEVKMLRAERKRIQKEEKAARKKRQAERARFEREQLQFIKSLESV